MRTLTNRKAIRAAAMALLAGVLYSLPACADPSITVDANPVLIPDGQTSGNAVVTWDAENNKGAEVWVREGNDKETKFSSQSKGSQTAIIKLDTKYTFTLYTAKRFLGPIKNPLAKSLASIIVTAAHQSAQTPPANFAGTWETTTGQNSKYTMTLQQTGDKVSGTYTPGDGKIDGAVVGKVLRFKWSQTGSSGSGRYVMADDGQSFGGTWNTGTDPDDPSSGVWNGTRQASTPPAGGNIEKAGVLQKPRDVGIFTKSDKHDKDVIAKPDDNVGAMIAITNVQVKVDKQNVIISFKARPNIVPVVAICNVRPVKGADSLWNFPAGSGYKTHGATGDKAKGEYSADMAQELEADTMYYYIINVPKVGGVFYQSLGKFTTAPQTTVKVTFEKVILRNDSDADSDGDLAFCYFVDPGQLTEQKYVLASPEKPLKWSEGEHLFRVEFVIENAVGELRLAVNGLDDDRVPLHPAGQGLPSWDKVLIAPNNGMNCDCNAAHRTFDLTQISGSKLIGFTMDTPSKIPYVGPARLVFTVVGTIEVTR
jgi:hypothetical protein